MRNSDKWRPSKYVYRRGKFIASRDRKEVGVASRLISDLIAKFYDDMLKLHASGKLLDLGCGKIPLYNAYKNYITSNVCVDWESTSHKNECLDFECDITKKLPFEDLEFNTIILSDVLEHIPNPENLWKEMSRILAVNGKLIINVPFCYWIHERPYDYYRYTEFALKRFSENCGLSLILLKPIGGGPEVLADILSKHSQFIPVVGSMLAIFMQYTVGVFVKTRLGRKISEKTAEAFPLGYFMIVQKTK